MPTVVLDPVHIFWTSQPIYGVKENVVPPEAGPTVVLAPVVFGTKKNVATPCRSTGRVVGGLGLLVL